MALDMLLILAAEIWLILDEDVTDVSDSAGSDDDSLIPDVILRLLPDDTDFVVPVVLDSFSDILLDAWLVFSDVF